MSERHIQYIKELEARVHQLLEIEQALRSQQDRLHQDLHHIRSELIFKSNEVAALHREIDEARTNRASLEEIAKEKPKRK